MESTDSFGEWLRRRRTVFGLTRAELAECAGCSVSALRKIEADERRPSRQLAGLLAGCLHIAPEKHPLFLDAARGQRRVFRLGVPEPFAARALPLAPAPADSTHAPSARTSWSLPAPATPTVGRDAELAAVAQLLADPACRLLTLAGPGGIGKTRLAIEAACNEWGHFADGVFFVSLAAISAPEFMVPAIAQALGFNLSSSTDPAEQLFIHLGNARVLLLLDNLEHLLDGMDMLARLLLHAPALKLLTTSRERLGMSGEWLFEVQGLAVPRDEQSKSLQDYGAVQLFCQRARQAHLQFEPSAEELPHVARICRLVDGLPLAIELAATWVPTLSCREIADEIERGLGILASRLRDLPERHHSMQAVFDHSWQLLTATEQNVLRQLAVFRGGFCRDVAQAVAGADLLMLSGLVAKSLIRRTAAGRYDLHPLVQQSALARLAEDPQLEEEVRDRHCEFYLQLLHQREAALKSAAQQETIRELTAEVDNVRLAWNRAVERERFDLLGPALRCFGLFFDIRGWNRDGIEKVDLLLRALSARTADVEQQKVRGQALAQQGMFYSWLGEYRRAVVLFEESLALLRPLNEPALLVDALVLGGIILHLTGEVEQAAVLLNEGLASARALDDQWYAAYALFNQGYIGGLSGLCEEGYEQMAEAIALWRGLGDPRFMAMGLNFIAPLAVKLGRLETAQECLEEGLALSTAIGDRWGRGAAYRFLGLVALARGDAAEAQTLLNHSLEILTGFVTGWDVVMTLNLLGQARVAAGELAAARACLLESLQLAQEAGTLPLALDALVSLARVDLASGEARRALESCLFVIDHPAAHHEALELVERIRSQVEPQLSPTEIVAAQARVQDLSLAAIVRQVSASSSGMV